MWNAYDFWSCGGLNQNKDNNEGNWLKVVNTACDVVRKILHACHQGALWAH